MWKEVLGVPPTSGLYQGGWITLIFQKVPRIGLVTERMSRWESGSCSLLLYESNISKILNVAQIREASTYRDDLHTISAQQRQLLCPLWENDWNPY